MTTMPFRRVVTLLVVFVLIASTLVGIAEADGDLDIDEPASTYIEEWAGTESEYVTIRNLVSGALGDRARRSPIINVLAAWHAPILLAGFVAVAVLILQRFWSYWSTLL